MANEKDRMAKPGKHGAAVTTGAVYYQCEGDIRGNCGCMHPTRMHAQACLDEDREGCRMQGGYSDRAIVRCPTDHSRRPPMDLDDNGRALYRLINANGNIVLSRGVDAREAMELAYSRGDYEPPQE